MRAAAAPLSPAAADALRAATATETTVVLNSGQLDRDVYLEVNKALTRIGGGGKWNRKAQAHVYPSDPRPDLAALIGDGDGEIAMPVDEDKLASFWRTPPALVEQMLHAAGVADLPAGAIVLEPSAGDGAIADAIRAAAPQVVLACVEPDVRRAGALREKGHTVIADTLEELAELRSPEAACEAVVMNPPFTVPGDAAAWATHVSLALDLLAPGGRLVAVVPGSYEFRDTRKVQALRSRVEALGGYYEALPDGAFAESGTAVRTGLLTVTAG